MLLKFEEETAQERVEREKRIEEKLKELSGKGLIARRYPFPGEDDSEMREITCRHNAEYLMRRLRGKDE